MDDALADAVKCQAETQRLLSGFVFDGDEATDPPRYLVKGVVPAEGITMVGGQSGAGKTFIVVDLAVSAALGEPFFGHRMVESVGTLILAAEGAGTLSSRIEAARRSRAQGQSLPIAWLAAVPSLSDADEVKALQPKIQAVADRMLKVHGVRLGLIIIDTLAAAFAMKDENDAAEAQQALRHMRLIGDPIGAAVLPVHHYGKNDETGLRGSSAYRAGADAVISVLADRNQVTGEVANRSLALAKTRFGEEGPIAGFSLRFIQFGEDDDGDPVGACVIDPALDVLSPVLTKRPKKDPLPILALKEAFAEVIALGREVSVMGDGPLVRAVTVEQLRPEFRRRYVTGDVEPEKAAATTRQALKRALAACSQHGFRSGFWGGEEWLWVA
ncbi:AAA family ATPase [Methylobacterium planeticum]|nr:AAA family ATPase [Methylobacterium planeticum]